MDVESERQKMMAGGPYRSADDELVEERLRARRLLQRWGAVDPGSVAERNALLEELFAHVGAGVVLESPFHCDYGWNITIGHDCYINAFCAMLDCAPVSIGSYAQIGPSVMLCAATHPVDGDERRLGVDTARPITLEENVWIGAGAIVGPGVTIGRDSVVGAGSVVVRDVPPGVVVAGNPCRVLRHL
jgi:maltose O-acetyltransferase